jgi:glucosyl-dolichyl phosphate glucuronosyltransferase
VAQSGRGRFERTPLRETKALITVAICTLNRAVSVRRTIESLAAMEVPDNLPWEVLVVNNNCTDHTDAVIASFAGRLPIRREFEPRRGLSNARNRAVDAADGDYIVWTDDDVVVGIGWLLAYAEAFSRWPQAAVFGGPITPRYAPPVPKWFSESEALLRNSVFGGRDFGDEAVPLLAGGRLPFGPNFAVRAAEQRRFRYNPRLGHAPGQRRRGEELDVLDRILQSGACGYWVPTARVEHCSDASQQTLRYIARYFATVGETSAFLEAGREARLWFGVPRWMWRQLVEEWVRYQILRLISPPPVWVRHLRDYAYAWGAIRYYRGSARQQERAMGG